MSFQFTLKSFNFHGQDFEVTSSFRDEASQHTLTPGAVATNLGNMEKEGVMKFFLTPTGKFGAQMAREIIRRREEYRAGKRKQDSVADKKHDGSANLKGKPFVTMFLLRSNEIVAFSNNGGREVYHPEGTTRPPIGVPVLVRKFAEPFFEGRHETHGCVRVLQVLQKEEPSGNVLPGTARFSQGKNSDGRLSMVS